MCDSDIKEGNITNITYSQKSSAKVINSDEARALICVGRTQGDGMENVTSNKLLELKGNKVRLGDLIYHPTNFKQINSKPPVTPSGTVVNLVPKSTTHTKKEKYILNSLKSKEPKFVPYEPYKAAVNPIIPIGKHNRKVLKHNSDIRTLVSELASLKTADKRNEEECDKKSDIAQVDNDNDRKEYESEIQKLKEENSQLENQLKFQIQVNAELKNLLVAAVGEDLESRVHLLTEDKLQLARALLNSAKHLSTHQEQTEWLAGQCEVWRSKFLASSLMVEELAKWKAALCQRTTDLQESIKRLFEERTKVRDTSFRTYRTLSILRENFAPFGASISKRHELASTNIIDLAEGCSQISELLKVQLLSGMDQISLRKEINVTGLEMKTIAEKTAEQLLMSPNFLMSGRQDAACSAVMGAAVALGGQIFLPHSSSAPNIACCKHCSGEIKQV